MLHMNLWHAASGRNAEEEDGVHWMAAKKSCHPQRGRRPTPRRGLYRCASPYISRDAWKMLRIRFGGPLFFDDTPSAGMPLYSQPYSDFVRFSHVPGFFELMLNEVPFWRSFGVEITFKTDDTKNSTSSHEIRSIAFSYPTQYEENKKAAR